MATSRHDHSCITSKPLEKSRGFLFLKKVKLTLDIFDIVIYVTRNTTGATTVFVSASACNPSFGQGYAHLL